MIEQIQESNNRKKDQINRLPDLVGQRPGSNASSENLDLILHCLANPNIESIRKAAEYVAESDGRVGNWRRTMDQVNDDHGVDFQGIVRELKKQFPEDTLEILVEGCGESTFGSELQQPGVKITRSDVIKWDEQEDFHNVSIHDLYQHFGEKRFHLIVSTRAGLDCGGDHPHSIANMFMVLKNGGRAYLTVTTNHHLIKQGMQTLGVSYKQTNKGFVLYRK